MTDDLLVEFDNLHVHFPTIGKPVEAVRAAYADGTIVADSAEEGERPLAAGEVDSP